MKEREIDLLDLIADILSHWRGLLIAVVLGAILMAVFSYASSYKSTQNVQQQEEKDVVVDEMTIEEQRVQLSEKLNDSQLTAVLTTVDDERECLLKNEYIQKSFYMQLDPLHVAQEELVYNIQGTPRDEP